MDYKSTPDIDLWQQCRKDDIKAYNELFQRYYPRMLHLACRYVKDTLVAEELCMDQLFNLWVKREQINIFGDFSNYLFRSMRNLVITHLRKNLLISVGFDEVTNEGIQISKPADYDILLLEAEQVYQQSVLQLSPRRREVFVLSRSKELTYAEIAKKLNLSVNTVENYMVAALNDMRENMKEYLVSGNITIFVFYSLFSTFL